MYTCHGFSTKTRLCATSSMQHTSHLYVHGQSHTVKALVADNVLLQCTVTY